MEHYDVTIIGAGLAGLHCARLLGKRGLSVLLVDRKESRSESGEAHAGIEPAGCQRRASLRLPILNSFAWHVFFGRGSFPDVDVQFTPHAVCETKGILL